jgi:hypothetical protein
MEVFMSAFYVSIVDLWLPILLSSVVVFFMSSVIHMVLGYHSKDFKKFKDEDGAADAIRKLEVPPGDYMLPYATSMSEMRSAAFQEKFKRGPRVMMTVFPGGSTSMAGQLAQWFIYSVVIGVFAAYIAGRALPEGAPYLSVFRFVGATAFFCYTVAGWQASIWYKRPWAVTFRNTLDGLIYALFTAGVFGWLWPR